VAAQSKKSSLQETHPHLAAQAAGWDPEGVTGGSTRSLRWRCPRGHEWEAAVYSRVAGSGCPVCAGRRVERGFNDLATTHPKFAPLAVFDATTVTAGSSKVLPWRCSKGHEWTAKVADVTSGEGTCPVCIGRRVIPGVNDLATLNPALASEALFDATAVTLFSNRILPWRCSKGHEWKTSPSHRSRTGCPTCGRKTVLPGFNDLATTHPELATEALFDATSVVSGSNRRLPWRCTLGHEWTAPVIRRAGPQGTGCPYCTGQKILPGFNDLSTTRPDLAAEVLLEDPRTLTAFSNKRVSWRCSQGHEWQAAVANRAMGKDCPYCSGRKAIPGLTDLATTHPALADEALFDPTAVSAGSNRRLPWRCGEGHEWKATPVSRTSRTTGCPSCAPYGYDINRPAWLYLLAHETEGLLQVGITGDPETRLRAHRGNGWEPLDIRGPMDGHLAKQWETDILDLLRSKGVPLGRSAGSG